MRLLFVHQNFPGQFKHLAPTLAQNPKHEVVAMMINDHAVDKSIRVVRYKPARGSTPNIHPWVADIETQTIRAEAAFRTALKLKQDGFTPDVIIAHPGWGESMFLKDVWPNAVLAMYCEFFYHAEGYDVGFDPEFHTTDPGGICRLRLKNINNLIHFQIVDAGISPTYWQASSFPEPFRSKISVIHDGIDTTAIKPNPEVFLTLNGQKTLTKQDEVITFVNRNLEPYRGYHIFMRALPEILKQRPNAHVVLVGGNDVSYGSKAPNGQKWRDIFLNEVKDNLDLSRVHFVGYIAYQHFIPLLQLSTVHVYLTYPFVLSWSLLEAMSAGCAIVASNTPPLLEAIKHNETGRLVDFFDAAHLANTVIDLLAHPEERTRLGQQARAFAVENYDLTSVCLPKQLAWAEQLGLHA
ncbi:glycosyltransferase family 4 protein [Methylocucumis oryzae]|uniref:Glycosyl transferase n=1 Tax=Methylocucumis oryzae TaxID=1632867 RepID=A0A0F3IGB8_9GAMM|nr:glycosyltransferase family 4 protein [Methylocucumis oryzae]KJV05568.1 hypothetical protein VZ94_17190 [Methylocucumis oryzae]